MSSVARASAAGAPLFLARGLCVAAVALTAGCSQDVTRFDLFGEGLQMPAEKKATHAPTYAPGGGKLGAGKDIKETSLLPVKRTGTALDDAPPSGPSRWQVKTADFGSKSAYAPSPWPWANGKESFPWPDPPPEKAPKLKSSFQGHYTTKRRDTLAAIAERYKVTLSELRRVNGIAADQSRVKTGTVLAIPAPGAAPPSTAPPRVVQVKPLTVPPPPKLASVAPPAPRATFRKSAAAGDTEAPPETKKSRPEAKRAPEPKGESKDAATDTTAARFRWPVPGAEVISTFGQQTDGSRNEGIKLAVPLGTDIRAAGAGRVHYAGDGLKGYGNLILIRHPNGWVSTYAHAAKMLVKVGEEVKGGQVIAKSGQSGPVEVPQLGFELRKGSVPVNPLDQLPRD
jgi:murein DD-endopeptidase MepM/ murein hydrolase activator NlpD